MKKSFLDFVGIKGGNCKKIWDIFIGNRKQFALLRHYELVKGQKRADGVYPVPFGNN